MLTVICPSRGRPEAAAEVMKTFKATAVDLDTRLVFVVDPDDDWQAYPTSLEEPIVLSYVLAERVEPHGMLAPLNKAITIPEVLPPEVTVVGFVGDDHRFRTDAWDARIDDLLELRTGVAYANDLFQGERLPTNWFVSRPIVNAFGMGLETLRHLYIDDYWKTFASAANCLFYLPEIIIEHMHPLAGKGQWDEGYRRVNDESVYSADREALERWKVFEMATDVAALKAIVG